MIDAPPPKVKGKKSYYRYRQRSDGSWKELLPPCVFTFNVEGDVTFQKGHYGRTPRKIKKWVRKEMGWGRWRPWWTLAGQRHYGRLK